MLYIISVDSLANIFQRYGSSDPWLLFFYSPMPRLLFYSWGKETRSLCTAMILPVTFFCVFIQIAVIHPTKFIVQSKLCNNKKWFETKRGHWHLPKYLTVCWGVCALKMYTIQENWSTLDILQSKSNEKNVFWHMLYFP